MTNNSFRKNGVKLFKAFVFITSSAGIAFLILLKMPNPYQYELEDWLKRLGTPVFIESPDNFSARDQHDLIREYQNRGYELQCYGNLQREERIEK